MTGCVTLVPLTRRSKRIAAVAAARALDDWFALSRCGDSIKYAAGPRLPVAGEYRAEVAARIAAAERAGMVLLIQQRRAGGFDWFATKKGGAASSGDIGADAQEKSRLVTVLRARVAAGGRVPSYADMAQLARIKSRYRARYLFDQLIASGAFALAVRADGSRILTEAKGSAG